MVVLHEPAFAGNIEFPHLDRQARSARRQRLVQHLWDAGERPVLEALLDVARGRDLDATLEDFGRIPTHIYHAVGADFFPKPFLIDCGAST